MQPDKTLDEVHKYLAYITDALYSVSQRYSLAKEERVALEKYAEDIFQCSKGIDLIKNKLVSREAEVQKHQERQAILEYNYQTQYRNLVKARTNVIVSKNYLKEISKSGSQQQINDAKKKVEEYKKQQVIAEQNEALAKREFEQGV